MKIDPQDPQTFAFQDSYSGAQARVQKLRLFEVFKVPRLMGFTMPAATDRASTEQNHMFKSVLFRPLRVTRSGSNHEPFYQIVNQSGSFIPAWETWFAQQKKLSDHCTELQHRAGKLFTISDVTREAVMVDSADGEFVRLQPSSAEFMAYLIVEVSTNLDIAAAARGRPRQSLKPNTTEFSKPEDDVPAPRQGEIAEVEDGVGGRDGGDQEDF